MNNFPRTNTSDGIEAAALSFFTAVYIRMKFCSLLSNNRIREVNGFLVTKFHITNGRLFLSYTHSVSHLTQFHPANILNDIVNFLTIPSHPPIV